MNAESWDEIMLPGTSVPIGTVMQLEFPDGTVRRFVGRHETLNNNCFRTLWEQQ